jgi:DNA-binding transcriptional regulator LsrR (DeoR family)
MGKARHVLADDVLFSVSKAFLDGGKVKDIADEANSRFALEVPLTRQSVYKALADARDRGFFRLIVPLEKKLAAQIEDKFGCRKGHVHVVSTLRQEDSEYVAAAAAELALELIREIGREKAQDAANPADVRVGLGLGPGRATLDFSRNLSTLLNAEIDFPLLNLIAISSGCPTSAPECSSVSFFNLFPKRLVDERVGLFAQALVTQRQFDQMRTRGGVGEAFKAKEQIDIIVNSMGEVDDEHDLLMAFLVQEKADLKQLKRRGWIANVQYRPYSATGPIEEGPDDLRAVTLFELREFAAWSQRRGKHVILIARQCALCGRTRAPGLLPLLTVPGLRVFDHLVLDVATARELIHGPAPAASAPGRAQKPRPDTLRRRAR